jgi:hypothetical protein
MALKLLKDTDYANLILDKRTTLAINCKDKKCTPIPSWKTLNHPHPVDNEILIENMFIYWLCT